MGGITDVPGLHVGHASDHQGFTGCTVILCRKSGAVGGADIRGSASGTREIDTLSPHHIAHRVHAILLAGGSAYGLDAAAGVMQYLEERGIGFPVGPTVVPIVPAAILFDLAEGDWRARPDRAMGYDACRSATAGKVAEGRVGAGTGCTVGKLRGMECATPGGIGSASVRVGKVVVGAIVAVNAFGDVVDPKSGRIIAGARTSPGSRQFVDTAKAMARGEGIKGFGGPANTTIGVVATTARLTKAQAAKVAQMAHDGLARAIRPAHTLVDGDTLFCLSCGNDRADVSALGHAASVVVAAAILRAVQARAPGKTR